jgi:endonuclease/exonuclease/phosphatase family metal-dependent hydrolase
MFNRSKHAAFRSSAEMLARQLGYHAQGSQRRSAREGVAIVSKYPFSYFDSLQLENKSWFGFPRVSVMGEFDVPGIGCVRVVDVHLTHWGGEHDMRHRQLEETLAWVAERERAVPADVFILGGDFNARPDSPELLIVNDAPREMDFDLVNFNPESNTKGSQGNWTYRVDYIFAGAPHHDLRFKGETLLWPRGIPKANGRGTYWPSDHLLVLHEYLLGELGPRIAANAPMNVAAARE